MDENNVGRCKGEIVPILFVFCARKTMQKGLMSRIPPRVQIRENASVELPHVMLLMDDRKRTVIEPLFRERNSLEKLYDFELNMGGGHLRGYFVADWKSILDRFNALLNPEELLQRYGSPEEILLAVGDGNHSLATAKACWEKLKPTLSTAMQKDHPARFALCEIVNIHDEGICFEPIHRAVFGVEEATFLTALQKAMPRNAGKATVLSAAGETVIPLPEDTAEAYSVVQAFLDEYGKDRKCSIDYIHGENSLRQICQHSGCVGILMPTLSKNDLFGYVLKHGALPRKTFSMGEAVEKRYYLEAKSIQNLE